MTRKRFVMGAICSTLTLFLGLWVTGTVFFPADYLAWYFPFHAYPLFAERGDFLLNHGAADPLLVYFPDFAYLHQQLQTLTIPLWNPLKGFGEPTAAMHGAGFMFPIHWLTYGVLSPIVAWHVELLVLSMINIVCAFEFFRRETGSVRAAALGATPWALGGWCGAYFMYATYNWTFILFPVALLGVLRAADHKPFAHLQVGLCIGSILLSSHLQASVPACALIVCFILWRGKSQRLALLLAAAAGVAMASPHLVPLAELLSISEREKPNALLSEFLLLPREYLCAFFPTILGKPTDNFYFGAFLSHPVVNGREHCVFTGVVTLSLAIVWGMRARTWSDRMLCLMVFGGVLLAGAPALYEFLCYLVDPLKYLTPTRFLWFLLFGVCWLAAKGWSSLEVHPLEKNESWALLGVLGLAVLGVLSFLIPAMGFTIAFQEWLFEMAKVNFFVKPPHFQGDFGNVFVARVLNHFTILEPTIAFSFCMVGSVAWMCSRGVGRRVQFAPVFCLLLMDLVVYFFTMNAPVPGALVFPSSPDIAYLSQGTTLTDSPRIPGRVLALGQGPDANLLLPYGVSNLEAYESAHPGDYRAFFEALNRGNALPYQSCVYVDKGILPDGVLDIAGVSKLYNRSDEWNSKAYGTPDFSEALAVKDRPGALRAFLLDAYQKSPREQSFQAMMEPDFEPRERVLIESPPSYASPTEGHFESISPLSYGVHDVIFQVESPRPTLLVLTDLEYPGWVATVNGVPAPILKAYGFARAVELPKGNSTVEFHFSPTGFSGSILAAVLAFLLLLLAESIAYWRRRP